MNDIYIIMQYTRSSERPVEYFELSTWQKNKNIGILESFQNATPI